MGEILSSKKIALAFFLDVPLREIEEVSENRFDCDKASYLVVDDDEAEELWDEFLDNLAEETESQLPQHLRCYFADDQFIDDCRQNGRANDLAAYDGKEERVILEIAGEEYDYYIYREN